MRGGLISDGTSTAGGPFAAVIAQARAANARDFGHRLARARARSALS